MNGESEQPPQEPAPRNWTMPLRDTVDWATEIQSLFADLAPALCDSPEKCHQLVVRLTLRDGSQYLVSKFGHRLVRQIDGRIRIVTAQFVGRDEKNHDVAMTVRPQDVLKVELVDIPEEEWRPPFGFARFMSEKVATVEEETAEGVDR